MRTRRGMYTSLSERREAPCPRPRSIRYAALRARIVAGSRFTLAAGRARVRRCVRPRHTRHLFRAGRREATGSPVDLGILIENVLNAVTAGITIGAIYGLMCIGLGLIFGIMRIVNFAQGELLMLGMFVSFYLVTGRRVLSLLGPHCGPFIGAIFAAPVVFAVGGLLHRFLLSRVSGLRTVGSLDEGHFGQLIVTLGISLILQNGGQIVFGSTPVAVRTPLSAEAFLLGPLYHGATVFLNKAKLVAFFVA